MSRLEHTKAIFGYIFLEAIVDGQLKKKINFNRVTLKKVYKITYIHKNSSPIQNSFKRIHYHAKKNILTHRHYFN